jgi:hypothetical protein
VLIILGGNVVEELPPILRPQHSTVVWRERIDNNGCPAVFMPVCRMILGCNLVFTVLVFDDVCYMSLKLRVTAKLGKFFPVLF